MKHRNLTILLLFLVVFSSSFSMLGCDYMQDVNDPFNQEDMGLKESGEHNHKHDHVHFDVVALPTEITLEREELPVPAEPPPIAMHDLPKEFPYEMTPNNKDIWESLIIHAAQDSELLVLLLPTTKNRALSISAHIAYLPPSVYRRYFEMMMWAKLHKSDPSDPHLLFYYTKYAYRGNKATRAEKLAYIYLWERLKILNDQQNVPQTSGLRKTYGLSQYYIDIGEYQKAIDNIKEQNARAEAVVAARIYERKTHEGILDSRIIPELELKVNAENK